MHRPRSPVSTHAKDTKKHGQVLQLTPLPLRHSINKAAFALVADGEDVDAIFCGQETVQCDVTGAPFRDNEFAQVVRGGTPNQRVALQYRRGIDDLFTGRDRKFRHFLFEELEYPFEVGQRLLCEIHLGHGNHRAVRLDVRDLFLVSVSLVPARAIGLGRFAVLPEVRASMYVRTSSIA